MEAPIRMNTWTQAARCVATISLLAACMPAIAADRPAASSAAATTRPTTATADLEQLQRDIEDFITAATRGDRVAALQYIGPASLRKRQAVAEVHIVIFQAEDAFRFHFGRPPTGSLGEFADTLTSLLRETCYVKHDGSAATSMLHFVKGPQGLWQIDAAQMEPRDDAQLDDVEQVNQAIATWTVSVRANTYATPAAALQAFDALLRRRPTTRP